MQEEYGRLRFDYQIEWHNGRNILEWSAMKKDATTRKFIKSTEKAVFTRSGTQATNETCKWHVLLLAEQEQRVEQFNLVRGITMYQLWQALIRRFG